MPAKKIEGIQALRGLTILIVVLMHCGYTYFELWGVTVFFLMSGMLLTMQNYNRTLERSFKKCFSFSTAKIKRLYLLHIITLIIMAVAMMMELKEQYHMPLGAVPMIFLKAFSIPLIPNLLLIQSLIPNKFIFLGFNGVSWYLSDMLFLYMLFPLFLSIVQKFKKKSTVYFSAVSLVILELVISFCLYYFNYDPQAEETIWYWGVYINPLVRALEFFVGCTIGWLMINTDIKEKASKKCMTIIEIVGFIFFMGLDITTESSQFDMTGGNNVWFFVPFMITLEAIFLVLIFTLKKGVVTCLLTNKVIVGLGNISPYVFLIHLPILELVKMIPFQMSENLQKAVITVITLAVSIGLSILYMKFEEHRKARKKVA